MVVLPAFSSSKDPFLRGGDVSEIPQIEDAGKAFSYGGKAMDPFQIMKKAGWNFVRFRVWNAPKDGYCDKAHTLAMAKRAKDAGLRISIDFHYSDSWADPGKQPKPAAWRNLPVDKLADAVHDFTADVVSALIAQGTPPIMVQVGNEITAGMLWPEGKLKEGSEGWDTLALLVKAGLKGVHDAAGKSKILTMIHLDRGGDKAGAIWWFDEAKKRGIEFDTIGLSYYPWWHGHLDALVDTLKVVSERYRKDVYVVETAYPWTEKAVGSFGILESKLEPGYAPNPDGQAKFLAKVTEIVKGVPKGRGKGILYWAPMSIPTNGRLGGWSVFATFDDKGSGLPAIDVLGGKL